MRQEAWRLDDEGWLAGARRSPSPNQDPRPDGEAISLVVVHNISPETMLCPCCPDSTKRVPQLGYHICRKQKGLLPEVLEPILRRRFCFKARAKNIQYDPATYKELQKAWKWVLVVCFGYTGYRNAR